MSKTELIPRIIENKDWITFLFAFAFLLLAINKTTFENRFKDFVNLVFSDKYLKIYKDGSNLMTWFTVFLFVVQLISFSFFLQLVLSHFGYTTKTNWISFIQIITFLSFFILSKFLIEKIVATSFNIESFTEQFNLFKVSYRSYVGLALLPINIIMYYTDIVNSYSIISIIIVLLTINMMTYLISLKNHQKLLFGKLFYFILYICALEIAPYYFMYFVVTRG